MPWGKKAVKIAISIGQDADNDVLAEFTGNRELVLQANNATALTKMIKWASTAASVVSSPASRVVTEVAPAGTGNAADQLLDQDDIAKTTGAAPLVLNMGAIPNPDEVGEGDVW